ASVAPTRNRAGAIRSTLSPTRLRLAHALSLRVARRGRLIVKTLYALPIPVEPAPGAAQNRRSPPHSGNAARARRQRRRRAPAPGAPFVGRIPPVLLLSF